MAKLEVSVSPEALARASAYANLLEVKLEHLVEEFFLSLPGEGEGGSALSPAVQRLLGVAKGSGGIEEYRRYLLQKYGGRKGE